MSYRREKSHRDDGGFGTALCGQSAPMSFDGQTGDCDRPQGHIVQVGTRLPGEPDEPDLRLHAAHLDGLVLYWSETDDQEQSEMRASADWSVLSRGTMELIDQERGG